jgi:hypothetical protein
MQRMLAVLVVSALALGGWLYVVSTLSLAQTVWSLFLSRVGTPVLLLIAGGVASGARKP